MGTQIIFYMTHNSCHLPITFNSSNWTKFVFPNIIWENHVIYYKILYQRGQGSVQANRVCLHTVFMDLALCSGALPRWNMFGSHFGFHRRKAVAKICYISLLLDLFLNRNVLHCRKWHIEMHSCSHYTSCSHMHPKSPSNMVSVIGSQLNTCTVLSTYHLRSSRSICMLMPGVNIGPMFRECYSIHLTTLGREERHLFWGEKKDRCFD